MSKFEKLHKTTPRPLQRSQNHCIPLHIDRGSDIFPSGLCHWSCDTLFQKDRLRQFQQHTYSVQMTQSTNIFGFPAQNGFDSCPTPVYPYIGGKTPQLATCIRNCPGFHLWIKTHPCKGRPLVLSVFQMLFRDRLSNYLIIIRWVHLMQYLWILWCR